ncbi:hypothetical protein [Rhodohalobacter sulfatireducens]|uniref:Uncharacterized protein n=1 Tax=Rhodohalobacter sulfatireducens TaxID=2911366 RepID=A0ABS9KCM0_9BACT|nr:hypothetical protein [Rhodohalobacter sulfatireducens]MCG2588585.1 hypothetical protein [Rhodohalobacter sulfatireducens]
MDNPLKHRLIDKILSTKNEEVLSAIDQLLDSVEKQSENVSLTKEQKMMLEMSEIDLQKDETISQDELDKEDLSWLNAQ